MDMKAFHLLQLKYAIRLEGQGLRHSSGRSALKFAKDLYGFTGSREEVLRQIDNILEDIKNDDSPRAEA